MRQSLGTSFCGFQPRRRCPQYSWDQQKRGPGEKCCRRKKSHASWPPLGLRGTSAGRRGGSSGVRRVRVWETVLVCGIPKYQETWFFQNICQVGSIVCGREDDVPNEIVTSDSFPTTAARQGLASPFVHDLSAERAVCVLRPDGQAKAGIRAAGCEVRGSPEGPAPATRLRQKCVRREEGREERRLCIRALKTAIDVELIEAWPDLGAELLGLGQAGDTGGRGMLRAPRPATETPRLPSLQSSSERGLPTRRPRE